MLERLVRVEANESLGSTHGVLFLAALNTPAIFTEILKLVRGDDADFRGMSD